MLDNIYFQIYLAIGIGFATHQVYNFLLWVFENKLDDIGEATEWLPDSGHLFIATATALLIFSGAVVIAVTWPLGAIFVARIHKAKE